MDEEINVLQVLDHCAVRGSPIHGVTRLLLSWVSGFRKTDIEISLCILRTDAGTQGFHRLGVPIDVLNRGKFDPRTITDLYRIIKRDNIQVLHCHGYGASFFGRIVGIITDCPVVLHEHMVDPDIPFYQKVADKILSPLTTRGIAVSHAVKEFMTGVRHIPEDKAFVIHNTVSSDFCNTYTEEEKNEYVKKYNIPRNKRLVGILGRLDPLKAHTDFLLAAKKILKVVPDAYFIIVGEGELRAELEDYAGQLGIQNEVSFLGFCENVKEVLCLIELLASSSLTEGLPLNLLEAMAQGKPVVATSVGGVPEVIVEGKTGFMVPVRSPDKLAEKIVTLLQDDDLRNRFGENSLNHCKRHFLTPASVGRLAKLYQEIL